MFQCEFSNFLECALDVMRLLELALRPKAAIKGWRATGSVVLLVIHFSQAEKDN